MRLSRARHRRTLRPEKGALLARVLREIGPLKLTKRVASNQPARGDDDRYGVPPGSLTKAQVLNASTDVMGAAVLSCAWEGGWPRRVPRGGGVGA